MCRVKYVVKWCVFLLTVLLCGVIGENESRTVAPPTITTEDLLQTYNNRLETTISAEQLERISTKEALDQFQVTQVKKMTECRLQMVMHRNHSFGQNYNEKWSECLDSKSGKIKYLEDAYSEAEGPCVQTAQAEVAEKKQAVRQIVKEIRQWRKGYRYLNHLCKENNPRNKASTGACLVMYMKRDNYDNTIARLLEMLEIAQNEFKEQINSSLLDFEECLQKTLSTYLEGVRAVRTILNKCYKRKNSYAKGKSIGCIQQFSQLKCNTVE